jgi:hypothetical protein
MKKHKHFKPLSLGGQGDGSPVPPVNCLTGTGKTLNENISILSNYPRKSVDNDNNRPENKKSPESYPSEHLWSGAGDRNRTGTGIKCPRDFKSLASACSATPA